MTDDEYYRLLKALGGKHLQRSLLRRDRRLDDELENEWRALIEKTRRFNEMLRHQEYEELPHNLSKHLEGFYVETSRRAMDELGILDALDEAPILLREFRDSALPLEDRQFLYRAGFTEDDVEVMILLVREYGVQLSYRNSKPSTVLDDADASVRDSIQVIVKSQPDEISPKKKRKILNGIGKVLGGSVAGLGNVLLATGTIAAPNPATAAGAIASGTLALTTIFGGLGDLRGE